MAFNRLIAVLPCYSLDDVSKELADPQIAEFHAAWTVLWHPALLSDASGVPEWKRADASSLDVEHALIVMPASLATPQNAPLMERLVVQNCTVATALTTRQSTLESVFRTIEDQNASSMDLAQSLPVESPGRFLFERLLLPIGIAPSIDLHGQPKIGTCVEDFYALGLATLLVQSLTRKIHYSSNLDVVLFAEQASTAAKAFLARNASECERWLQSCFDQLSQERDRYFTQSAHLVDLTLVAPTTLKGGLDRQLAERHPQNLLASAAILEQLSDANPDALQVIIENVASNRLTLAGGSVLSSEQLSQTSPSTDYMWLTQNSLYHYLLRSRLSYLRLGLSLPTVFAQLEPGITWDMPTVLKNIGYKAALLHAFSETSYPVPTQSKITWEASDNKTIDTIASGFLDASFPKSVFSMISDLGKQFDYHQIPTLVFAHWPDRCCDAFHDLVTATRRTSALGQWTTLTNYFESTGSPYSSQTFSSSQFPQTLPQNRGEYRRIASTLTLEQQKVFCEESTNNLAVITDLILRGKTQYSDSLRIGDLASKPSFFASQVAIPLVATTLGDSNGIKLLRETIGSALAGAIPRDSASSSATTGLLLFNPFSGPQRIYLSTTQRPLESSDSQRIYASHTGAYGADVILDLPPMGVLRLSHRANSISEAARFKAKGAQGPLVGSSSWLLANEFIECQIDPKSGYLRSLMVARKRGGKLSGMPAIVISKPEHVGGSRYATPANVANQYLFNSPLRATIKSCGDLVLEGKCYGTFEAEYTLWRGARHVDVSVCFKIDQNEDISDNNGLWQLAPVWRTAWPSPATTISTWIHGARTKAQGPKANGSTIYAPELIEFDDAEHRLYLTTIGAPIHRRVDSMFLETLVPSDREVIASHRFRLGMDWPRPYQTLLESLEAPWQIEDSLGDFQSGGSLWMVQVNQPNVRVTCEHLLMDSNSKPNGVRVMIQETSGRSANSRLSFYRDVTTASKVQIDGSVTDMLTIDSGEVILPVKANECSFIDVSFTTA